MNMSYKIWKIAICSVFEVYAFRNNEGTVILFFSITVVFD